jgi:hypothetical protein
MSAGVPKRFSQPRDMRRATVAGTEPMVAQQAAESTMPSLPAKAGDPVNAAVDDYERR